MSSLLQSVPDPRAAFETDGFLLHPQPIVPPDLIRRAADGMDAVRRGDYDTGVPPEPSFWKPGDDPGKLCKIEMPQAASRAIFELVSHPALGELAARITGAEWIQVWWVQLLYKPSAAPGTDSLVRVGWHQDRHYWGAWEPESELFTAWIALSDVDASSGPMRFVRGSHRWGLLEGSDFYGQNLDALKAAFRLPRGAVWEEVPALLPAGGLSFHHCLSLHGSGPNVSGRPRRSFAVHMRTERSAPVGDRREGLTRFLDDPARCPVFRRGGARRERGRLEREGEGRHRPGRT